MTGPADCWLLLLVVEDPERVRLVVGVRGDAAVDELVGMSRRLEHLFDAEALSDAPETAGWWLWQGRVETVGYTEDDTLIRWCGRWAEATLEDLYRIGLDLPRPENAA